MPVRQKLIVWQSMTYILFFSSYVSRRNASDITNLLQNSILIHQPPVSFSGLQRPDEPCKR